MPGLALVILILVFLAIFLRGFIPGLPSISVLMALGAVLVIVSGEISLFNAFKAINLDVILYLFGVFVLSQALEDSGTLAQLGTFVFWGAPNGFSFARVGGGGRWFERLAVNQRHGGDSWCPLVACTHHTQPIAEPTVPVGVCLRPIDRQCDESDRQSPESAHCHPG